MSDLKLLKIVADHAIKSRGTTLQDPATSNFDRLVTPESVYALAYAHEQSASDLIHTQKALDEAMTAVDRLRDENDTLIEALENFVNDLVPSDPSDRLWAEGRRALAKAKGESA